MRAAPDITPETDDQFKARVCSTLGQLTELALALANRAAARALDEPEAEPEPGQKAPRPRDPHADFARAANAARQFIALEHRIRTQRGKGGDAKAPPKQDRRRQLVQAPFTAHLKSETGAVKTKLRQHIEQTIEHHLETMPDAPALEIYEAVCNVVEIHPDPKHLSDEILGLVPPVRTEPAPPGGHRLWAPEEKLW